MGDSMKIIIIIQAIVWGGAILAFPILLKINKAKAAGTYDIEKQQKYHIKFHKYRKNVFFRERFRRIEKQFATFACYDEYKIEQETVKTFENALYVSVFIPILIGVLMRDILMFGLSMLVGYLYYDIAINRTMDKINVKLHQELAVCIQSMRDKYQELGSIPRAIVACDKGTMLDKPIMEIYEILNDHEGEKRLYKFCQQNPIRLIKTLATTCYIVNMIGDRKTAEGASTFGEDLITIRQEVDAEIRRLDGIRIAFKSLPIIALLGIFMMPIEEWYLLSQIPGTSKLIKGTYGMVLKILVVVFTAVVYYMISISMRPSVVNESDRGQFIDHLLLHRRFKLFIGDLIPKKQKTIDKITARINGALTQKDMYWIYASKVIYSVLGFVAGLVFAVLFIITTRSYMYTNYKPLSFTAEVPLKAETFQQVKLMDAEYLALDEPMNDDDCFALVKGRLRGMQDLQLMQQRDRLQEKYKIYHSLTWNWKWGLLPILASIICWFIPEMVLMFRTSLIKFEADEDVMQLQTMCIVLSATELDAFKGLYWLEKQSSIHKEAIRYCYHEYTSDPIKALENLWTKTNNVEFKKIIRKFESASGSLSLSDAFSDIKLDKQQYAYMRESLQKERLESKKQNAKLFCFVPPGIALLGLFILPILILGISQLTTSMSSLVG